MIAEPYIITKGPKSGNIYWVKEGDECNDGEEWGQPYADFEREKLHALYESHIVIAFGMDAFSLHIGTSPGTTYNSGKLIGYYISHYCNDTESNRLLKRVEFLKDVCEREGIEWLPDETRHEDECVLCGKVKRPTNNSVSIYESDICSCNIDKEDKIHEFYKNIKELGNELNTRMDIINNTIKLQNISITDLYNRIEKLESSPKKK